MANVRDNVIPLLEVRELRKHYPIQRGFLRRTIGHVKAVDGVNFEIYRGGNPRARGRIRLREEHDGTVPPAGH